MLPCCWLATEGKAAPPLLDIAIPSSLAGVELALLVVVVVVVVEEEPEQRSARPLSTISDRDVAREPA